jgi:hypothetical protein
MQFGFRMRWMTRWAVHALAPGSYACHVRGHHTTQQTRGSKCVSMMWRALVAWPYSVAGRRPGAVRPLHLHARARQGLTLVHFSAQPEPFLSPNIHGPPSVSNKRRLSSAEKCTSVSPWRRGSPRTCCVGWTSTATAGSYTCSTPTPIWAGPRAPGDIARHVIGRHVIGRAFPPPYIRGWSGAESSCRISSVSIADCLPVTA